MDNKKIVKKYLIVIPARGGSKSVPKKNIKDFAGKPLICHTIDSLEKLKQHYDCVLTSDSREPDLNATARPLAKPFLDASAVLTLASTETNIPT